VVHLIQVHALQVGDVARQTERQYLAFARFHHRIPECEPFHDHTDKVALIPFPDDVLSPSSNSDGNRKAFDGLTLGGVKRVVPLKFPNE
jgi:hypothetical protein